MSRTQDLVIFVATTDRRQTKLIAFTPCACVQGNATSLGYFKGLIAYQYCLALTSSNLQKQFIFQLVGSYSYPCAHNFWLRSLLIVCCVN